MIAAALADAPQVTPQTMRLRLELLRACVAIDSYPRHAREQAADFLRGINDPYAAGLARCLLDDHRRVATTRTNN